MVKKCQSGRPSIFIVGMLKKLIQKILVKLFLFPVSQILTKMFIIPKFQNVFRLYLEVLGK